MVGMRELNGTEHAITVTKNDEFQIEAFFWEKQDESSRTELRNVGSKIAGNSK